MTSATDTHAAAVAAIAARRETLAAGTERAAIPWDVSNESARWSGHNIRLCVNAAVNDYGPLLDIAAGVLERHAPDPEQIELMLHMDDPCPTGECVSGDGHLSIVCRGCYPEWDGMQAHSVWPCPEAAAVLGWLGLA